MSARRATVSGHAMLATVTTVGGLIPADLLSRIVADELPGLTADDYRLELGVSPREAANRAWSVLTGAWLAYRDAMTTRPDGDRATGLTRDKWQAVVLRELGFGRVAPTPAGGIVADGRGFPVSHQWRDVPVHLLGWNVDLDHRTPGVPGAAERPPHAMVQELLNRSDDHLWALLANGSTLRLLRDSSSLVGQAYVEFDLAAMFDGEVFSDFVVLYLLCHESRFEPVDPEAGPEDCWLERWRSHAVETGVRALGALRLGVRRAIEVLGTGFLRHPDNAEMRRRLDDGALSLADYHRGLLRLVYRLLFCFVAEDRGLLLDPEATDAARRRFTDWFATARLRGIATRRRGSRHHDQWQMLSLVLAGLGRDDGLPELGLPALGGLFEPTPADVLDGCQLANEALLEALRHLSIIQPPGGGPRRMVDYRHLGAEELGGIYESLLELVPRYDDASRAFGLEVLGGNERRTSGSYYTPTSLIDCLLDSALDPLLDEAEAAADPGAALLGLTVCDPACGSGHFLVAAARRIAARLARVRAEGGEPSVVDAQGAMHDVVARCVFGVDINPLAAELAKVSLWLEAMVPGRPLSFLDSHVKVGNALLGTTPSLLAAGIPDEAFAVLEGDDREVAADLRRRNRFERERGQGGLFTGSGIRVDNRHLAESARAVDATGGLSLTDIALARRRHRELERSSELRRARLAADGWCAAFVIGKCPGDPELTQAVIERWQSADPDSLFGDPAYDEVRRLSSRFRFFHWHLEFPQVFAAGAGGAGNEHGWAGGFSCVLGNPPWEHVELKEQEFFASTDPEIATATGSRRKKLIASLADRNPDLHRWYLEAKRHVDAERAFLGGSGRYPHCGRGRINTYAVFAEADRSLLHEFGRLGVILPTGIATDATTQHFFKDLVVSRSLVSLYDFENARPLFDGVHRSFKFCLLTLIGRSARVDAAEFSFFAHHPGDLARPDARFELTPEEIALLNPNTGTCPVFRRRRDAEITLGIYRRVPVLIRHGDPDGNSWGVSFKQGLFNMTSDSGLFRTRAQLDEGGWVLRGNTYRRGSTTMLPLYEAKMVHHFDHRWATYDESGTIRDVTPAEHQDPDLVVQPRYWVPAAEVESVLAELAEKVFSGFRRICRSTDERTMVTTIIPAHGIGDSIFLANLAVERQPPMAIPLSCFALDFAARQKLGGTNMNFFIAEQLPILEPRTFVAGAAWDSISVADWMAPRTFELTYTAWDMEPFARDLGDAGPPFRWDDRRRAVLRAELDGAFFHLYGIERDNVDYILSTFPIVHRNDEARHGEHRTWRLVLDAYDQLAAAIDTGEPFQSTLDPPPGHGPRHPAR